MSEIWTILRTVMTEEALSHGVLYGLILLGFMKFSEWWFGQFADWCIKMAGHLRRLFVGLFPRAKKTEERQKAA